MHHDPLREIQEIQNQLSYSKRLGFLLGAGTSKALGMSDLKNLTVRVEKNIDSEFKDSLENVKGSLHIDDYNIEDILNHVRLIRQITNESVENNYNGVNGEVAKSIDTEICNKIYDILVKEEESIDLAIPKKYVGWLNWLSRDFTKEIFTANYDLILEKSFESLQIPYFDGFVGANEPFFLPESLEQELRYNYPPQSWIRLWKIHGSLGWFWKRNEKNDSYRIVRLGVSAKKLDENNELVIYPSREKYESSRKQPFLAYFDRLRSFLLQGEGLFIICGYSFSDEHINNIIFDCLRQNNRLHILGFFYSDDPVESLSASGSIYMNFSVFGSKTAIINGNKAKWKITNSDSVLDNTWDKDKEEFLLGDFNRLVDFLLLSSGRQEQIKKEIELE